MKGDTMAERKPRRRRVIRESAAVKEARQSMLTATRLGVEQQAARISRATKGAFGRRSLRAGGSDLMRYGTAGFKNTYGALLPGAQSPSGPGPGPSSRSTGATGPGPGPRRRRQTGGVGGGRAQGMGSRQGTKAERPSGLPPVNPGPPPPPPPQKAKKKAKARSRVLPPVSVKGKQAGPAPQQKSEKRKKKGTTTQPRRGQRVDY